MRTLVVKNNLEADMKIAHCDCAEFYFLSRTPDAEIRKQTGKVCLDCSSKIEITLVAGDCKPVHAPRPTAAELDASLKSTWSWLGI